MRASLQQSHATTQCQCIAHDAPGYDQDIDDLLGGGCILIVVGCIVHVAIVSALIAKMVVGPPSLTTALAWTLHARPFKSTSTNLHAPPVEAGMPYHLASRAWCTHHAGMHTGMFCRKLLFEIALQLCSQCIVCMPLGVECVQCVQCSNGSGATISQGSARHACTNYRSRIAQSGVVFGAACHQLMQLRTIVRMSITCFNVAVS